jgi:Peptidyl-prolyl cis-trans isomerase (rotamase) - cyclophilin family
MVLFVLLLALVCTSCTQKPKYEDIPNPLATITMEDGSVMRFELQLSSAPITVANFAELANQGFYDGLTFYRIVPGVFIESGSPTNDGYGDAGYTIKGEFEENGVSNTLSHNRGVISMARLSEDKNSASSAFFILQGNYPDYDGKYAAFGIAADEETLRVIDSIGSTPVDGTYRPLTTVRISNVRVNTHGYELTAPHIAAQEEESTRTNAAN